MFRKSIITIFLLLAVPSNFLRAQIPHWQWAQSAGSGDFAVATSSTIDRNGNLYVTGYFSDSSISFGSFTLSNFMSQKNTGYREDIFLVKYDSRGDVVWAKSIGGSYADKPASVKTDPAGNIYLAGSFSSPAITFGSDTLPLTGKSDVFLAKYDFNGNALWAKSAGGPRDDEAVSVALDPSGNCYVTGDFDSPEIIFGNDTLRNGSWVPTGKPHTGFGYDVAYKCDLFVAKYDTDGKVLWATSADGKYSDFPTAVVADTSGNVYVAGYFRSPTILFGTYTLFNADTITSMIAEEGNFNLPDIFLAKYDKNGSLVWAKNSSHHDDDHALALAIDPSGNIYMTGYFSGSTISFDNFVLYNKNDAPQNIFLVKYDKTGKVLWAKRTGKSGFDEGRALFADDSGNCYMAGDLYSPSLTFGKFTLRNSTSSGTPDILVVKYGITGNVIWAKSAGGKGYDEVQTVVADASGNCFVAGAFTRAPSQFGDVTLVSGENYKVFIAALSTR